MIDIAFVVRGVNDCIDMGKGAGSGHCCGGGWLLHGMFSIDDEMITAIAAAATLYVHIIPRRKNRS